jgi:hypothetical protein
MRFCFMKLCSIDDEIADIQIFVSADYKYINVLINIIFMFFFFFLVFFVTYLIGSKKTFLMFLL